MTHRETESRHITAIEWLQGHKPEALRQIVKAAHGQGRLQPGAGARAADDSSLGDRLSDGSVLLHPEVCALLQKRGQS